jgi:hypothetical protein
VASLQTASFVSLHRMHASWSDTRTHGRSIIFNMQVQSARGRS